MNISESVKKTDHEPKITGEAVYIADYPPCDALYGKLLRSAKARARIVSVCLPDLPEGYLYVDKNDVPGENRIKIVLDDMPVFADSLVEYIGDPIGMMVGPDSRIVDKLIKQIIVEYEELPPIIHIDESDTVFFDYPYSKGNTEEAFAQADAVYEETFETGLQEHAYLETNGVIAVPENGGITVHGSLQCPYYVHGAIVKALGYPREHVRVKFDTTGGAFGGKEDYPSILATQAAVAAVKANHAVRLIFSRREDMEFTSKRHPSKCRYKVAVKGGRITAMDIDLKYNAGAYTTLSMVVLQRGVIAACGVYHIENLSVRGRAYKTNTAPNGAFRGFGGPQPFFGIEMMMNHIAKRLGVEPLTFKEQHISKKGNATSTNGQFHFDVPLYRMIEQMDEACNYREKRELYKNQTGKVRRGIGISLSFHGAGFTGAGERDLIKAVAKLRKLADGRVEILTANTDMGQGLYTTFTKIVANELKIPMERIIIANPDTKHVPDSGPTVASRSMMVVGELLRRAAVQLKEEWKDGVEQEVLEHFKEPDYIIPFDLEHFKGDAYPTYSWAVHAVEVEIDTLTGVVKILGAYGSFDVGTPIDRNIVIGQMEGGLLQGIGYASIEKMDVDARGRIRNNSYSDYIVPTSLDVPNLKCMLSVAEYPDGPYGAKGAGELPTVGGAAAYLEAMEQALNGVELYRIPFNAENVMEVLRKRHD